MFWGGLVLGILGLGAVVAGSRLYTPGHVTVGRRLAQVGLPLAGVTLLFAGGAAASGIEPTTPSAASGAAHAAEHGEATATAGAAAGAHTHDETGSAAGSTAAAGHDHTASAVPPKPYDPNLPIDLSGVPGVTPQQQARAENLIAITLHYLPKYADYRVAERDGYRSIGDAITGDEHFINTAYFDDGRILDPEHAESLVYEPDPSAPGGKKLSAAMYMLAPNQTLADVPDVGGPLTQWHIHNNLCFTADGRVAGITSNNGACGPGLNKGSQAPMLHVWIEPHECGPFAALEGVGAGQIQAGQTRACDTAHGAHSP
jgi:hypothetical protein